MYRWSNRQGFTLIELMVVIAIIGVLVALLFPVFSRVREKARQARCQHQMMQLVTALNSYHKANGHYPRAWDPNANGGAGGWVGVRYNPGTNEYEGGFSELYPDYINERSLFICPDDHEAKLNLQDCYDRIYCSYNGIADWDDDNSDGNTWDLKYVLYNYHGYTYSSGLLTGCETDCEGHSSGYDTGESDCILPGYAGVPGWMNKYEPDPAFPRYIPDFLEKAGLSWQHFPALANHSAPDYTIATHCIHHRRYGELDLIVRVTGETDRVNPFQLGDPEETGVPPLGWQGTTDPVAGWVHQNF